jgi:hypothetical protein
MTISSEPFWCVGVVVIFWLLGRNRPRREYIKLLLKIFGSVFALLFAGIVVVTICAYRKSGKWVDDSKNWERAFGGPAPKGLTIVHSIYWRTPHFTYEGGWTFDIKSPPAYYKEWLAANKVKHPRSTDMWKLDSLYQDRPAWFLPKPMSQYEIWVIDEPDTNFALFIDRSTDEWFVTDSG